MKASLKSVILSLLMLITLILSTDTYSDGYTDVGYKDGFNIEVAMNVDGPIYLRAELGEITSSYGIGLGYDFNPINVMITADRTESDSYEYGIQLAHYDIGFSYFADLSYKDTKELGYKIGLGWSFNEKVSVLIYHADDGAFFGLRRLF
jgi:hypothetical protein